MNTLSKQIKDTFIYGYPIVGMYELFNSQVLDPETRITGINEFLHVAQLSSPKTSFVPAPNNDTTYSRAWLDLRREPVIIDVPDTEDRFYSIQFLDLFSETIVNVGRRTTGTAATRFAVVGPDYREALPEEFHVIRSSTSLILAFLRILIKNETDLKVVKDLQKRIKVYTLSAISPYTVIEGSLPSFHNQNYKEFFETLSQILLLTPAAKEVPEIQAALKEIPLASPDQLKESCDAAMAEIEEGGLQFGEDVNHWRIARKNIGNYGDNYFKRAVVWHKGALANQPEESLYPSTFMDENGDFLDGHNCYRIVFHKESLPPVSQFWSLTMYIFKNAFLYDNPIDRYSIGERTGGLHYGSDGSLTIYIQHGEPDEPEARANWLPAPREKFYMTLRLYGPSPAAVTGAWTPPTVKKI